MSTPYTGGCLCKAVRYQADGEPSLQGICFCKDCQRASGSFYIPFMSFPRATTRITGEVAPQIVKGGSGKDAVRNFCDSCGAMIFGAPQIDTSIYTIYAGSLDDPARFKPTIAMFARNRPHFFQMPPGLKVFDGPPVGEPRLG